MTPADDRVCTHTAGADTSTTMPAAQAAALTTYTHPHLIVIMPAADTAAHTTYVHPPAHNYELFGYGRSRTQ